MSDFKGDKIIDSRNIIARIDELQGERETLADELEEAIECVKHHHDGALDECGTNTEHDEYRRCKTELAEWDADNAEELAELLALAEQGEGYGDWSHGETLILESHFEDYAQELAEDIGAVNKDAKWPNNHIDWEAAADELRQDYTELDFGGETYLMRS